MQRAHTLAQSGRHLVTTIVGLGVFFHLLEVLGWDLRPLLVGASVLGAALAFGAQTMVRMSSPECSSWWTTSTRSATRSR